ncbi:TIGR03826 family flagellar region protein [Virgibacillus soli]|uniref:Flagellar protein n=1 Tax=Paracerasibacillus soli TaxID=480284 RepID=A0ABU5CRB9_9BACI|nr:TIGR03826 family flagellar region protein [Virgibacillus soli]MDY0408921.1 hypothetical protein [Virgibacillus soli]
MGELANCSRCGAVFVKQIRDICHNCYQEEEKAFKIVYAFLTKQKNREATIQDIVEATEIEEELIIKFIKEGRLRQSQFPKLSYPCERCGRQIVTGKLCQTCMGQLKKDLTQHEQVEALHKKHENEEKESESVYFALERYKK